MNRVYFVVEEVLKSSGKKKYMIEATDATVVTSLKNQSLRSSKKTQILSEKNYETRKKNKKRKESL